ncbi:DUF4293 domain-containing protein [Cytophaga aurantiaca]|uniref:DUF4293 domain-containing protein n=1 Tax=Cytophaga aurantiaca TaxID=29530 RepID=UPI0003712B7E|nr:DUF4293 domain-containing protein [Cytophaga aurantiaca]
MIQRIQSILLLISALILSVCLFTPAWEATSGGTLIQLNSFTLNVTHETTSTHKNLFYIAGLIAISILLTVFIIFKYKDRVLQMRLNMMNTILICLIEGLYFWHIREVKTFLGTAEITEKFGLAFYMPLAALVLCFIAGKRIQKDEELVKSVDRIR